jgi:hypothetical protein
MGVDVNIHVFLISALVSGELLASLPGCYTPVEKALRYPLDRSLWALESGSMTYRKEILFY